ncbi:MAG: multiheme c-type cytochrome [Gemmataceae bacterium]
MRSAKRSTIFNANPASREELMPAHQLFRGITLLGLAGLSLLTWSFNGRGQDKDGEAAAAGQPRNGLQPLIQGVSRCFNCHTKDARPDLENLVSLCRCDEVYRWGDRDRHQDAYRVLQGERAVRMGEIMNARLKTAERIKPEKNPQCLGCHSLFNQELAKESADDYQKFIQQGVTCVACHGPYENWVDPHGTDSLQGRKKWRQNDRKTKETKFGMTDLWDARTRTQVCGSCHIGDADPGKNRILTHEMYAAGHPPLPGFDTCKFSDAMPRHWEMIREKPEKLLTGENQFSPYPTAKNLEQTALVVIGEAAGFMQTMDMLASQAAEAASKKQIIDLAQFDCAACHHDLVRDSWRQTRGYKGTPGRPQFRPYSGALMGLAIHQAAGSDPDLEKKLLAEWQQSLGRLRKALDDQPFGDPGKVSQAAKKLSEWTNNLVQTLNAPFDSAKKEEISKGFPYGKKQSLALLRFLAEKSSSEPPDFDQARQIAWAWSIIYGEVQLEYQKSKNPEDQPTADRLKLSQAEIKKNLQILERGLDLALPYETYRPASESKAKDYNAWKKDTEMQAPARQKVYDDYLSGSLAGLGNYGRPGGNEMTPAKFKELFAELAKSLPEK